MTEMKLSRRDSLRGMVALGAISATAAVGVAALATPADAAQVHMDAALVTLNQALHQLQVAMADKGGYRVKAIASVKDAIADVEAGIKWDRTH